MKLRFSIRTLLALVFVAGTALAIYLFFTKGEIRTLASLDELERFTKRGKSVVLIDNGWDRELHYHRIKFIDFGEDQIDIVKGYKAGRIEFVHGRNQWLRAYLGKFSGRHSDYSPMDLYSGMIIWAKDGEVVDFMTFKKFGEEDEFAQNLIKHTHLVFRNR